MDKMTDTQLEPQRFKPLDGPPDAFDEFIACEIGKWATAALAICSKIRRAAPAAYENREFVAAGQLIISAVNPWAQMTSQLSLTDYRRLRQ
jgi:hypothetical protein